MSNINELENEVESLKEEVKTLAHLIEDLIQLNGLNTKRPVEIEIEIDFRRGLMKKKIGGSFGDV